MLQHNSCKDNIFLLLSSFLHSLFPSIVPIESELLEIALLIDIEKKRKEVLEADLNVAKRKVSEAVNQRVAKGVTHFSSTLFNNFLP